MKVDLPSGADSWEKKTKQTHWLIVGFRTPFEWECGSEILGSKSKEERKKEEKRLIDAFSCAAKT